VPFFVCLVLHVPHWTSERLWRHELCDDALCAFCAQGDETIAHLMVDCSFAREIWFRFDAVGITSHWMSGCPSSLGGCRPGSRCRREEGGRSTQSWFLSHGTCGSSGTRRCSRACAPRPLLWSTVSRPLVISGARPVL
jgi:hypothetical protein